MLTKLVGYIIIISYPTKTVGIGERESRYDFIDKGQIWIKSSI
jgi:hypothetical protein